jgi:hypothetical protein
MSPRYAWSRPRPAGRLGVRPLLSRLAALACLLAVVAPMARADDDEDVLEALQRWLEQPLDLREATATELVLLPWIDPLTADAIVGLRDAGALQRIEDLRLVPGIDAEILEALRPFVSLSPAAPRPALSVRLESALDSAGSSRHGGWAQLQWGAARALARLRRSSGGAALQRGALDVHGERLELVVGDLQPATGSGLLLGEPAARSRTGPVALGERFGLRPYTATAPPRWRGLAGATRLSRLAALAALADDPISGRRRALVAGSHALGDGGALVVGGALAVHGGDAQTGLWVQRTRGTARLRCELAMPSHSPARVAAALEARGERARLGLALTADPAGLGEGEDPITRLPLDRPHGALQATLVRRVDRWSATFLARRMRRGAPGAERTQDRFEADAEGPGPAGLWRAWARVDLEGPGPASPELTTAVRWRDPPGIGGPQREVAARRLWSASGGGSILIATAIRGALGGTAGAHWLLAAAACSGGAAPWAIAAPGYGAVGAWVPAGGARGVAALSARTGDLDLAAYLAAAAGGDRGNALELGVRLMAHARE